MARNLSSKFNFNADEGLGFAKINDTIHPEKKIKEETPVETKDNSLKETKSPKENKQEPLKHSIIEKKTNTKEGKDTIAHEKTLIPAERTQKKAETTSKSTNTNSKVYNIDPAIPLKDQNIFYHQDDCTPKVASLLEENMRYIRIRAKKLGIPMNLFVNIVIDEYRAGITTINDENRYSELYNKLTKNYKGSKVRTNFFLIKENAEFIEDEIINIGCQPSQYFNYIISNEKLREEEHGARI